MVDFRKSLLLLAILLMMSSMASAQFVNPAFACTASAGVPPIVRAEGLAEYVGDVVLNCTGGTPTLWNVGVPLINWRVYLNTNVTSALLDSNWTESILAIDDPAKNDVEALRGPLTPANPDSGVSDILRGTEVLGGINYKTPNASSNQLGAGQINSDSNVYNVFQGELVADNQIEWRGVPIDPPGTVGVRIIRITNVRANANAFGVSGTFVPAQLTMFVSATGPVSIPINNPTQIVAVVQDGMTFDVLSKASYLQCEDNNAADKNSVCGYDMLLRYKELFPTAFKPVGPSNDSSTFGIGSLTQTESNYRNTNIDGVFDNTSGLATQGTRLLARFNNVPAGVTIKVWSLDASDSCVSSSRRSTIRAVHVPNANANGDGGSTDSKAEWRTANSSATWEIKPANPATDDRYLFIDQAVFAVDLSWDANTSAGIPALGTATVNGSYAPLSTRNTAGSYSSYPHPRFFDDSEAKDLFTINSCATNLLWPYVTSQAGFDTGMVISNTSKDPFKTATQEGACTIYYYGFTTGGGAAPAPVQTPVIPAGEHAIWTLSSGGTVQTSGGTIAAVPGFQGYVIAHCEFQMAHGYAFISDLGASKLAQGYLALIMDEQFGLFPRTGSQSEVLGN